jgi:hypothetical protein
MAEEEFIRMQQVTVSIRSIKIVPLLAGLVGGQNDDFRPLT